MNYLGEYFVGKLKTFHVDESFIFRHDLNDSGEIDILKIIVFFVDLLKNCSLI